LELGRLWFKKTAAQYDRNRFSRYPHDIFLDRIWELRNTMTAYDAAFVALAESLPAPLLTCDAKLAATTGHSATITLAPYNK
jgi:predicted nucleic acid-binding protein